MIRTRLTRFIAVFTMFAIAGVCLMTMVGLSLAYPEANTIFVYVVQFLLVNLTFASAIAGLYVLDTPKDEKGVGIRNLTPAGWILVAGTCNRMAGLAIVSAQLPSLAPYVIGSPRLVALLLLLPAFCLGWFVLTCMGIRVWRKG